MQNGDRSHFVILANCPCDHNEPVAQYGELLWHSGRSDQVIAFEGLSGICRREKWPAQPARMVVWRSYPTFTLPQFVLYASFTTFSSRPADNHARDKSKGGDAPAVCNVPLRTSMFRRVAPQAALSRFILGDVRGVTRNPNRGGRHVRTNN
jgi:hypothetical protein